MKEPELTPKYETCVSAASLGYPQGDSYFICTPNSQVLPRYRFDSAVQEAPEEHYDAPTSEEILSQLPQTLRINKKTGFLNIDIINAGYRVCYIVFDEIALEFFHVSIADRLVEALMHLWIKIKE